MITDRSKLMSTRDIPLIENIVTWQGEGCNTGKRMYLVRFKRCSCHCPFCDTWTKMSDSDEKLFCIDDINSEMKHHQVSNLMITGGEPTLDKGCKEGHRTNLQSTIDMLTFCHFEYADVETNGYNIEDLLHKAIKIQSFQTTKKINISYSPKFFKIEDVYTALKKCEYVSLYQDHLPIVKVVVNDAFSFAFARQLINDGIYKPNNLYLMPLGTNRDEISESFIRDVVPLASELKCNISGRMHLVHNFA